MNKIYKASNPRLTSKLAQTFGVNEIEKFQNYSELVQEQKYRPGTHYNKEARIRFSQQKQQFSPINMKLNIQRSGVNSRKRNVRTSLNQRLQKQRIKDQKFIQTMKEGYFQVLQRPQSKQQPRIKLFPSHSMAKHTFDNTNRPQSSKGHRPRTSKTRQNVRNSLPIVDVQNDIKTSNRQKKVIKHPLSATSRNPQTKTKINFQTSLDPQFLNLFAN